MQGELLGALVLCGRTQEPRRSTPALPEAQVPACVLLLLAAAAEAASVAPPPPPISLSDKALLQLKKLRSEVPNAGSNLLLRVGVKQGG